MRVPKSDKVILEKLAFEAPLTIYSLNKITGYSTSTIHASIHRSMRQNLVKRDEKGYMLTVAGLIKVLQDKAVWENINDIAISNKSLMPEYFELWDTFERMNVKEIAVRLLRYVVRKLSLGIPSFPEQIEGRKPTFEDWLPKLAIYPYDAMLEGILTEDEAYHWHQMLFKEPKAEKLFLDTLTWMYESHEAASEIWRQGIQKHHELKAWFNRVQRVVTMLENIKDPYGRLKALKQDKDLWETILRMYQVKDERELLERLVKEWKRPVNKRRSNN